MLENIGEILEKIRNPLRVMYDYIEGRNNDVDIVAVYSKIEPEILKVTYFLCSLNKRDIIETQFTDKTLSLAYKIDSGIREAGRKERSERISNRIKGKTTGSLDNIFEKHSESFVNEITPFINDFFQLCGLLEFFDLHSSRKKPEIWSWLELYQKVTGDNGKPDSTFRKKIERLIDAGKIESLQRSDKNFLISDPANTIKAIRKEFPEYNQ